MTREWATVWELAIILGGGLWILFVVLGWARSVKKYWDRNTSQDKDKQ